MLYCVALIDFLFVLWIYIFVRYSYKTSRWIKYIFSSCFWLTVTVSPLLAIDIVAKLGFSTEVQMISGGMIFVLTFVSLIKVFSMAAIKGNNVVHYKYIKDFVHNFWDANTNTKKHGLFHALLRYPYIETIPKRIYSPLKPKR
jgi:hypothetical protein